MKPEISP